MASAKMKTADPVESLKQHPTLDPATAGRRVHEAVGRLLDADVRAPRSLEIVALARDMVCTPGLAVVRRQSAIQRLAAGVATYFRLFALDASWTYVGAEIAAQESRFDLVFRSLEGEIIADELKAARAADRSARRLCDEQIERQLRCGTKKWGESFLGVRVLFLSAPAASFLARPGGNREGLEWGGQQ